MRRRLVAGLVGTLVVVLVWVATHTRDPRDDVVPPGSVAGATTTVAVAGGRVVVELERTTDERDSATSTGAGTRGSTTAPRSGRSSGSTTTTTTIEAALRWDVDLAGAAQRGQAAICGTAKGFHLAVVDRSGEGPVVGMSLRADAVSPAADVAVAGTFVMDEGDDVGLEGTLRLDGTGVDPQGTLRLRDDDGEEWTGTFRCTGP